MGYYTRMEFYWVVIKPKYVNLVKNAIRRKNRKTRKFQYILENLEVDSDGWLDWNWDGGADSCGKNRGDAELADWLKKYCEGGFIASRSLEGDRANWAYEFDGNGGVSTCSAHRPAAIAGWLRRKRKAKDPGVSPGFADDRAGNLH